jgi:hypothetical protein
MTEEFSAARDALLSAATVINSFLPSASDLAYAPLRPDQMLADGGPTLT